MRKPVIELRRPRRRRLLRVARGCKDAALRVRYMIVVHSAAGKSQRAIAQALGCSVSTVKRVRARWRSSGEAGLADRREGRPPAKATASFAAMLRYVLGGGPRDFGHRRPTWTQELLARVLCGLGEPRVSVSTISRLLRCLGVRLGMPKPAVACPWGAARRRQRLAMIRSLVGSLPDDEAAVWEDEVDVHLNPRVGPDWTLPGTQRVVMTPGRNEKRYVAGAMDAVTGRLVWVAGGRKDSGLFVGLLKRLLKEYPDRKVIHVILDNYTIHASKQTRLWLAEHGQRFRLHFLPPYCPDDNRIERAVWREVHANVTRNHTCPTIGRLMAEVVQHLMRHNRAAKLRWLKCA